MILLLLIMVVGIVGIVGILSMKSLYIEMTFIEYIYFLLCFGGFFSLIYCFVI